MKNKPSKIAIATILIFANNSFANSISSTLNANASIQSTCSIRANDFSFGDIVQFKTELISHSIFVKCNNSVGYTINGDDRAPRGLYLTSASGEKIQYAVLTSPFNAWSTVFTNPSSGVGSSINGVGTGKENPHQVYLRVYGTDFGGVPLAAPGFYSDTFNISITY